MPGVAWAQPDGGNTSAGTSQSADAGSTTDTKGADEPSRTSDENTTGSDRGGGSGDDAAAATDTPETRENTETTKKRSGTKRGSAAANTHDDAAMRKTDDATGIGDTKMTESATVFGRDISLRDADDPVSSTPAETHSAAEVPTAAPGEASVDTDKAAAAPTVTLATVFATLFSPRATPNPADTPETPPASPLLWTMLGYAKRQAAHPSDQAGSSATTASISTPTGDVQAAAGSSQLPGQTVHAPVIAADGTVYQVTYSADVTRVFILDENAQVVASGDITGRFRGTGVTRPDGSLIVIAANDRGTRSTVYGVDSTGAVTTIRTVLGSADSPVRAGADGALYFSTSFTNPFDPFGSNIRYRSFRISPTNGVRTFAYNTSVDLRPDGTAFLLSSNYGFSTLRVLGPTGVARTLVLPYGSAPSDPIVGLDGTVYVTAGVTGFFGTKTTRVYTFTGTSNTVRTVEGLPGDTVATPDGLYLETFTYSGSTDSVTGT
ncbi:hypothetical protein C6A85_000000106825, partial [Mycobacterium sp. ITM-2017-0098]